MMNGSPRLSPDAITQFAMRVASCVISSGPAGVSAAAVSVVVVSAACAAAGEGKKPPPSASASNAIFALMRMTNARYLKDEINAYHIGFGVRRQSVACELPPK